MLSDADRTPVFVGEDLTDEVKILSDRADFTGTYSHIFKGACRGEEVAIKVLKLVSKSLNTTKRKFRRELTVWKHVNHPNISPFYGYTEGSGAFGPVGALISPWYDNGDAETFLEEKGDCLSTQERIDLWRGVVSGVCYLHEQEPKIVHGDLKLRNILIDERGSPRICDFGLACIYLEDEHTGLTTTSSHTGTERYLAPELLEDDAQPSTASDIWALGCIGLQFLYSMVPYQHRKNNRTGLVFQDIRQGVLPATPPIHDDARFTPFSQILVRCWSFLPNERIDAPNALLLFNCIGDQENGSVNGHSHLVSVPQPPSSNIYPSIYLTKGLDGKPLPRTMVVTATFTPSLSDELPLAIGETVSMLEDYLDGWCFVQRIKILNKPTVTPTSPTGISVSIHGTVDLSNTIVVPVEGEGNSGAVPRFCVSEWPLVPTTITPMQEVSPTAAAVAPSVTSHQGDNRGNQSSRFTTASWPLRNFASRLLLGRTRGTEASKGHVDENN